MPSFVGALSSPYLALGIGFQETEVLTSQRLGTSLTQNSGELVDPH